MRLISLLKKYNIEPNLVSLDQCFMVNVSAIKLIVSSCELNKNDIVLEIGSGTGILTSKLSDYSKKVYAVEKDKRLNLILYDMLAKKNNVEIIIGDIKKQKSFFNANKIVSNLPYNICDWFFEKLNNYDFDICVVTIPLKFFNNQVKKYENLDCKLVKELLPKDFFPQPKIKSAIVKIIKKN